MSPSHTMPHWTALDLKQLSFAVVDILGVPDLDAINSLTSQVCWLCSTFGRSVSYKSCFLLANPLEIATKIYFSRGSQKGMDICYMVGFGNGHGHEQQSVKHKQKPFCRIWVSAKIGSAQKMCGLHLVSLSSHPKRGTLNKTRPYVCLS